MKNIFSYIGSSGRSQVVERVDLASGISRKGLHSAFRNLKNCHDVNLYDLSHEIPILLVFFRFESCSRKNIPFFRLLSLKEKLELEGVELIVVHPERWEFADRLLESSGVKGLCHISDPKRELFRLFRLEEGQTRSQFQNWSESFHERKESYQCSDISCYGGSNCNFENQIPGVFLIHEAEIIKSHFFEHCFVSPNFLEIASYPVEKILYKHSLSQ